MMYGIAVLTALTMTLSAPAEETCPKDLGHLEAQLPAYETSELARQRNLVLITEPVDALILGLDMGYAPVETVGAAFLLAEEAESALEDAAACIEGKQMVNRLEQGTYRFGADSVYDRCAADYIAAYYDLLARRESALTLACVASQ